LANYTDMTDEEYDALDAELTVTIPKLGANGTGFLSLREMRLLGLANRALAKPHKFRKSSNVSVDYLLTKAAADRKSPARIIDELVLKEVNAASV